MFSNAKQEKNLFMTLVHAFAEIVLRDDSAQYAVLRLALDVLLDLHNNFQAKHSVCRVFRANMDNTNPNTSKLIVPPAQWEEHHPT